MESSYISSLVGGAFLGAAGSVLLLFNGRILGISGLVGGIIKPSGSDWIWRVFAILGLIAGGFLTLAFFPSSLPFVDMSTPRLAVAGLLVGFGTQLGSGCTSGHGVCGIGRLSRRSISATITFIGSGAIAVLLMSKLGGSE